MQSCGCLNVRVETSCASLARALLALACVALASGCDVGSKPEPPYKDPPPNQRIKSSQALLVQYQCGSCHEIPDVPSTRAGMGPSLEGFGRRSYIAGEVPNSHEALSRWIVAPGALVPGTAMPAMGVSPQDAKAIASYLLTLT